MNLNRPSILIRLLAVFALGSLAAPAAQTNVVDPRSFDAFKIIIERNIFDPNRQPPRKVDRPPPVKTVDIFSLTGTMSYENGPFAVFDGNNQDYHKVVGPGGKIAVYTIAEIRQDFVKLVNGTNVVELKVGMQCRRSEDGKWSPAESADNSFAFNSNSRSRTNGRNERRSFGRNNSRGNSQPVPAPGTGPGTMPVDVGGGPPEVPVDPNDVVARLMALRAAQLGGNAAPNEDGGQSQDPNSSGGNPNDNPNGTPNGNEPVPVEPSNGVPNPPNRNLSNP